MGLYDDIGNKIKNWAMWIFIIESIGAVITGFVFLISWGFEDAWWALFVIFFGPIVAYVSSWLLYAFGQLVENIYDITIQNAVINRNIKIIAQPIIDEVEKKRKAEDDAKHEAKEKAKREAEEKAIKYAQEKARREAEEKAKRETEKTFPEKLTYALMFQSDSGMISYLKTIQDETIQNILKLPENQIREQVKNLLSKLQ